MTEATSSYLNRPQRSEREARLDVVRHKIEFVVDRLDGPANRENRIALKWALLMLDQEQRAETAGSEP